MEQYGGLIPIGIFVLGIVIAIIRHYMKKDRNSIDREMSDMRAEMIGIDTDFIRYKENKETSCLKHMETIQRMEIEVGKRKGESDLLAKDLKRIEDTMDLKLKAIENTGNDTKIMVQKIYDALHTINIPK